MTWLGVKGFGMAGIPSAGRVLITGGAGYIGSHTVLAFLEAGWAVTVIDNLSTGLRERVPDAAEFLQLDCADRYLGGWMAARKFDAAVHFAARIKVDESTHDPAGYWHANTCDALAFLKAAADAGIGTFVFSSTAAVYGDVEAGSVEEDSALMPVSPYGHSKLATEWFLQDLSTAQGLRHVILRYFNVAGADPLGRSGPGAESAHLLKIAAEAAAGLRDRLVIHGTDWPTPDGTGVRDYVHVTDLAQAHVAAVRHLVAGGESLTANCGYGHGHSVRAVAALARELAVQPFEVVEGPRRAGDVASVVANPGRAMARLGWKPEHDSLEAMLKDGIAWELRRASAPNPERPNRTTAAA
jgi:UDP-glucose 4-epimerase